MDKRLRALAAADLAVAHIAKGKPLTMPVITQTQANTALDGRAAVRKVVFGI